MGVIAVVFGIPAQVIDLVFYWIRRIRITVITSSRFFLLFQVDVNEIIVFVSC